MYVYVLTIITATPDSEMEFFQSEHKYDDDEFQLLVDKLIKEAKTVEKWYPIFLTKLAEKEIYKFKFTAGAIIEE